MVLISSLQARLIRWWNRMCRVAWIWSLDYQFPYWLTLLLLAVGYYSAGILLTSRNKPTIFKKKTSNMNTQCKELSYFTFINFYFFTLKYACITCKLIMQYTKLVTFQNICFNYNVHCISFPYNLHSRKRKPISVTNTGSVLFCLKKSVYQDSFVKTEEASTYQELDLPDSAYQNTTLRWQIFSHLRGLIQK